MSNLSDFKMVTKAVAAAIFDVCPKTIDNYIRDGRIPAPISFGSRDYWHPDDFQMFLEVPLAFHLPTGRAYAASTCCSSRALSQS